MFWECHVVTSSIDKLLDQAPDQIRLQDFLEESDLIQECLNQNQRLLDYLIQPQVMNELIHQIITVPHDGNFRNASVASELLTGDFQRIQESLLLRENLDILYSFLFDRSQENEEMTLNPILSSYFARIFITLTNRRANDLLSYLKSHETFAEDFIRHLDSTSIADVLFRLVADAGEQRPQAIQWYEEINLIDRLMREFRETESRSVQMNIGNLFSEFLRLAFDQQTTLDLDPTGPSLTATIERLLFNKTDSNQEFNRSSNSNEDGNTSKNEEREGKFTPILLAEHILSRSNLEQFLDALAQRPSLVISGCDFLDNILDLLSRHMPMPVCLSWNTLSGQKQSSDKDGREQMQINDEGDHLSVTKSNENANATALTNLAKDPLVRIYVNFLDIIPSRLPALIALLSSPSIPINASKTSNLSTMKYQFINQPLGPLRLNLIKFFSKLIQTISNDYTGDHLFEIFNSHRLFPILIDLFQHYVYNNFLHTQVSAIIRLVLHINATAAKQPDDIWTRTPLNDQKWSDPSTFHYTNRSSHRLLQSIFNAAEENLFERLFDQYERQISPKDANNSDVPFTPPNSGHVAQILRCLRDHAATFDHYSLFFNNNDQKDRFQERWQKIIESLNDEEKKWSAMHLHERQNTNTFALSSAGNGTNATSQSNDNGEASQRRLHFHARSFGSSAAPYTDDDDDDEVERFDIDDELMNNEQNSNERKVAEMKKTSFEVQFPAVFDEQTMWYRQDATDSTKVDHENMKMNSAPTLPDLFEQHRKQQEKTSSATESSFEQLCSLRSGDHPSGSALHPLGSSSSSSSTLREEATTKNDAFWQKYPIHLAKSNTRSSSTLLTRKYSSSSSDENSDDDNNDGKLDADIPDDENFFMRTNDPKPQRIEPNNMMDVFRRQPSPSNMNDDPGTTNSSMQHQGMQPMSSSTPERVRSTASTSSQWIPHEETQGNVASNDENQADNNDEDAAALQDNFSFLIAKGMLKPTSF